MPRQPRKSFERLRSCVLPSRPFARRRLGVRRIGASAASGLEPTLPKVVAAKQATCGRGDGPAEVFANSSTESLKHNRERKRSSSQC